MKQAQRKSDVKTKDMTYYVFDVIPLADFERGYWNAQQHKRTLMLEINKQEIEAEPNLRLMPGMMWISAPQKDKMSCAGLPKMLWPKALKAS
jgi:hypothetical protein